MKNCCYANSLMKIRRVFSSPWLNVRRRANSLKCKWWNEIYQWRNVHNLSSSHQQHRTLKWSVKLKSEKGNERVRRSLAIWEIVDFSCNERPTESLQRQRCLSWLWDAHMNVREVNHNISIIIQTTQRPSFHSAVHTQQRWCFFHI